MMMMMTRERLDRKLSTTIGCLIASFERREKWDDDDDDDDVPGGGGGGNIERAEFCVKKKHRREKRQQTRDFDGFRLSASVRGCRENVSFPIPCGSF